MWTTAACTSVCVAVVLFNLVKWACNLGLNDGVPHRSAHYKARHRGLLAVYYTCTTFWFGCIWIGVRWSRHAEACALVPATHVMERGVVLFYGVQAGFYFAGLYELICQKTPDRAKDWIIMIAHHVVTLFLIIASFGFSAHWVGVYVMGLHDIGDVFLYASDALHTWTSTLRKDKTAMINTADGIKTAMFAIFTCVFAYTRLYLFAWHLTLGACWRQALWGEARYVGMWIGLAALSVMHCYWFHLVVKMLLRLAVSGGDAEDVRNEAK